MKTSKYNSDKKKENARLKSYYVFGFVKMVGETTAGFVLLFGSSKRFCTHVCIE